MDDNVVDLNAHRTKIEQRAAKKLEETRAAIQELLPIFDPDQLPWVTPDVSKIDPGSSCDRMIALDSVIDSLTYSMITLDRLNETSWANQVSLVLESIFGLDEEE